MCLWRWRLSTVVWSPRRKSRAFLFNDFVEGLLAGIAVMRWRQCRDSCEGHAENSLEMLPEMRFSHPMIAEGWGE